MKKTFVHGIEVNHLPSKDYKHMMIVFSYYSKLDPKTYNERNMIPTLLENHNRIYDSSDVLNTHLDMLYGASFNTSVFQRGHLFSNQFYLKFINQKYIDGEDLLSSAFEFLYHIIYQPKIYGGKITKKAVKQKISETKELLNTLKQDKATLAYFNFLKHVSDKETATFYPNERYLDQVTQSSLTDVYQQMINEDYLKIYILGEYNVDKVHQKIKNLFPKKRPQTWPNYDLNRYMPYPETVRDLKETDMDVSIARTYVGYQLELELDDRTNVAIDLLNRIIGGYSQSKLFTSIREDLHLVYYIYSSYLSEINLFMIHFESDEEDIDTAIQKIHETIHSMQSGQILETELQRAQLNLIKNYKSMCHHLIGTMKLNMSADVTMNEGFNLEEKIQMIMSMTQEDLMAIAKKMKHIMTYRYVKEGDDCG